jgi:hypothetical protein
MYKAYPFKRSIGWYVINTENSHIVATYLLAEMAEMKADVLNRSVPGE